MQAEPYKTDYNYTLFSGIYSFLLLLSVGSLLSLYLVYPAYSPFSIGLQLTGVNLWVYLIHRICHSLPNQVWNYHIYSHHNKLLGLSRPVELICEFFTDFSWFLLLLGIKLFFQFDWLSTSIILFVGIWYSTVHVLNLSLGNYIEHKLHHVNHEYNYGPPYMDFLFGTLKVDKDYTSDFEIPNGVGAFVIVKALQLWLGIDKIEVVKG